MPIIKWNPNIKLVLSDIDETIADIYMPASSEMINSLNSVLRSGVSIFFVTGAGLARVTSGITDLLNPNLKSKVLVAHCSGAEVYGFNVDGSLHSNPFYSIYEQKMNQAQRKLWREIVNQIIKEFQLEVHTPCSVAKFVSETQGRPLAVMLEDRGPQITLEVVNGYSLTQDQIDTLQTRLNKEISYDLRLSILDRAQELFNLSQLPISAKLGGVFALDFPVKGVSKELAVKAVVNDDEILQTIGLTNADLNHDSIEIWGDKFSSITGGTDRHMSTAVDPRVRSIDFRPEDPTEFLSGLNIQIWDGDKHLQDGCLEYLQQSFPS